jgi:hypothetical protein
MDVSYLRRFFMTREPRWEITPNWFLEKSRCEQSHDGYWNRSINLKNPTALILGKILAVPFIECLALTLHDLADSF